MTTLAGEKSSERRDAFELAPLDGFRPDVQGLRGLAVLIVVLYHAQVVLPGGFVGVDVFFVISGFVIGRLLLARFTSTRSMSFRTFYVRRARRLLPALGVMLALVLLVTPLLAPAGASVVTTRTGVAAALFSANAYLYRASAVGYFDAAAELNPLLHTWSLSVEEQFYFLIPGLLWLAWRFGRRSSRPLLAVRVFILGLFSVSFAACVVFSFGGSIGPLDGLRFAFFSPVTRAWEFAVGLGLVVLPRRLLASSRVRPLLVVVGLMLIGSAAVLFSDATVFPGVAAVVPVLGTALVIHGGTTSTSSELSPRTWSVVRPMAWLGDISYSWYLWHWPFIVFAGAFWPNAGRLPLVAAAVVSLVPAWLSYRYLEQRLRATSTTRTWPTVRLAACCIAAPLVAAALVSPLGEAVSRQPDIVAFSRDRALHQDVVAGCNGPTPLGERDATGCVWGDPRSATSVVLVGDSNASHFSEALIGAAESTDARLQISTLSACPFVDVIKEEDNSPEAARECSEFVSESVEAMEASPPDVVVIANGTDRSIAREDVTLIEPDTGTRWTTQRDKVGAFERGLERVVSRLTASGIRVAVVNVVPKPWAAGFSFDPRQCSNLLVLVDAGRCSFEPFDIEDGITLETNGLEERAATAGGGETWDFSEQICPDGRCTGRIGDVTAWSESMHLSVPASTALAARAATLLAGGGTDSGGGTG